MRILLEDDPCTVQMFTAKLQPLAVLRLPLSFERYYHMQYLCTWQSMIVMTAGIESVQILSPSSNSGKPNTDKSFTDYSHNIYSVFHSCNLMLLNVSSFHLIKELDLWTNLWIAPNRNYITASALHHFQAKSQVSQPRPRTQPRHGSVLLLAATQHPTDWVPLQGPRSQ